MGVDAKNFEPGSSERRPLLPSPAPSTGSKIGRTAHDVERPERPETDRCGLTWIVLTLVVFHTLYFGVMRMSALPRLVHDVLEAGPATMGATADGMTKQLGEDAAKLWGQMARYAVPLEKFVSGFFILLLAFGGGCRQREGNLS